LSLIWYFFLLNFISSLGLGIDLVLVALASASIFWPRLTLTAVNTVTSRCR